MLSSFQDHQVVPDVLLKVPNEVLKVVYPSGVEADMGNELKPAQVKDIPEVSWAAESNSFYTLSMIDPDAPTRTNATFKEMKHWLVVNIPGSCVDKGEIIAEYIGSGPPKDTGLHRYIFLVYKQPSKLTFNEQRVSNRSRETRRQFKITQFADKYSLRDPVAGNFYQAQFDDYVPILHAQLSG